MLDCRCIAGFVLLVTTAVGGCGSRPIDDPIEGVPVARQRAVSRTEFGFRWPLSVGVGVLACDQAGTILFRTQGATYPLTGRGSRIADLAPYRMLEASEPPTNPLRRVKQNDRMAVFASVMSCAPQDTPCSTAALQRVGLTRDEWNQIETEGRERRWPPLTRGQMPLDPLIAAGRPLCDR
jgi:Protein of unknown function (DUF2511)